MPRRARTIILDTPHHVTQRGNNRQQVFFADSDYRAYLGFLKEFCSTAHLEILGYCLMPNHVHLVAVPHLESAFTRGIGFAHQRYTLRINHLQQRSGHLWQNRFSSCPMDEAHLWRALRYVELNPVRAGLVRSPWEYPWSSASAHLKPIDPSGLLNLTAWQAQWETQDWREYLLEKLDPDEVTLFRQATLLGRPIGHP